MFNNWSSGFIHQSLQYVNQPAAPSGEEASANPQVAPPIPNSANSPTLPSPPTGGNAQVN